MWIWNNRMKVFNNVVQPLTYFPSKHLWIGKFQQSNCIDDVSCSNFRFTATDLSGINWTSLAEPQTYTIVTIWFFTCQWHWIIANITQTIIFWSTSQSNSAKMRIMNVHYFFNEPPYWNHKLSSMLWLNSGHFVVPSGTNFPVWAHTSHLLCIGGPISLTSRNIYHELPYPCKLLVS